jgi:hypothetical protein
MKTFTLDHNVIIDLEEKREPNYSALCKILNLRFNQMAITAVSASENPPISNFRKFKEKIVAIREFVNIKDNQILKPMIIYNFTFYDWSIWGNKSMSRLIKDIKKVLFPGMGPVISDLNNRKIRNQFADIMTFWCHIYYRRDTFITTDTNFHKKVKKLTNIACNYHGKDIEVKSPLYLYKQN